MAKTTILLSHERSGSHFVSGFLGSLEGLKAIDEICNPGAIEPQFSESFLGFRAAYAESHPDYLRNLDFRRQQAFMDAYFDSLRQPREGASILVDVKYAHLHQFEFYWSAPFDRPYLLRYGAAAGVRLIHLYRRDVVATAISAAVAQARGVWHSTEPGQAVQPVKLCIPEVVRAAKLLQRQNQWLCELMASQPGAMTLTYERAVAELGKGGDLDKALADHVGGSIAGPYVSAFQKVLPALNQVVENYYPLVEACIDAGLSNPVRA